MEEPNIVTETTNEKEKVKVSKDPVDEEKRKKENRRIENIFIWFSVIISNGAIIFASLSLFISTLISITTLIVANVLEKEIIYYYKNTTNNSTMLSRENTSWATYMCIVGFVLEFITVLFGLMALVFCKIYL